MKSMTQKPNKETAVKTKETKVHKKNVNYSVGEYVQMLSKFVPSLVIQNLIGKMKKGNAHTTKYPEIQEMETVVIFADISGFTALSEACSRKGIRGNEELAFCINRYMEGMVENLNKYGGDIIKFVGDAMIVMWPPVNPEDENYETNRLTTIRKALQCCQEIQICMNNLTILPGVQLSVKVSHRLATSHIINPLF